MPLTRSRLQSLGPLFHTDMFPTGHKTSVTLIHDHAPATRLRGGHHTPSMLHTLFCTLFLTMSHTLWRGVTKAMACGAPPFATAHGHTHLIRDLVSRTCGRVPDIG